MEFACWNLSVKAARTVQIGHKLGLCQSTVWTNVFDLDSMSAKPKVRSPVRDQYGMQVTESCDQSWSEDIQG